MAKEDETRTCVRCFNVTNGKDKYCKKCGAPLINRCSDEGGRIDKGCSHVNDSDAAFCARCGCQTTFRKQGLV